MTKKKGTTQKSSKPKSTTKKGKIEKIEKRGGIQSSNKPDKRKDNGGSREGAGRPKNSDRERLIKLKDMAELFALEEVEINQIDGTTVKKIKVTRAEALLGVLFQEGFKQKNISAIKEFFDRTRGRARQEIELSGEIDTGDQYIPTGDAIDKAYAVFEREQRKLIAKDYDPEK